MIPSRDVPSQGPEMPFPAWGGERCEAAPAHTLRLLHLCMQSPSSWQGEIHPEEVPSQQGEAQEHLKDETWLQTSLVCPWWGSTCVTAQ